MDTQSSRPTFEAFARDNTKAMVRLAYLVTGNHQDAEDLAQETLMHVARKWHLVSAARNRNAYWRRIMVNRYLSSKRRKRVDLDFRAPADLPGADGLRAIEDVIADRDELRQRLFALPERQRMAVVLRYYERLDPSEIAAWMGITESAVRSTVTRGLQNLRPKASQRTKENNGAQ